MDYHIKEYYCPSSDESPRGNFHKVIALHEAPDIDWESLTAKIPSLCRGWYELAHLSVKDRIEFTRDFWLSKLPYHLKFPDFLMNFFDSLDDIGVFITQQKFDDPLDAHLVYSLKGNSGFYSGSPPISEEGVAQLQREFSEYIFPDDYLAFLKIHDGFSKTTDCTGIIKSSNMYKTYEKFQEMLAQESLTTSQGAAVNPKTLIPFYESFGMPFFQCFWAEWYPENEMGNVYYSGTTKTISDVKTGDPSSESMAFPVFSDWLMFYLEQIK